MSYGMEARVGISFQNSYGTANVGSMHWLEPISESVILSKAQNEQKGLRGIYDKGPRYEGLNTIAGDIVIEARANSLGVMLAAVNGSPTTVTSAALSTHTFKPRTADHSTLSAERPFTYHKFMGDTGSAQQYSDMNGTSLELSISNGELMTAKLGVVGGTMARSAAIAATYGTSDPLDWSISSMSFGGAGLTYIRQMTIMQENNLQAMHVIDTKKFPARIKRSDTRNISVSGTFLFDDQVQADVFINQTTQAVKLYMRGNTAVQSGYFDALLIDIPALRYTEYPLVVGGPGQLEVSFKAEAIYSTTSATAIAYTLDCSKAGF